MILALSIAVFFGGIASLAWAADAHIGQHSETAPNAPSHQPNTSRAPTGELLASPAGRDTTATREDAAQQAEPLSDETAGTSGPEGTGLPEPALPSEDEPGASEETPAPPAAAPSPGASGGSGSQQGFAVHHTAGRETAVYKTVHHQASVPREVTVGGATRIEWTTCPICGERHVRSYNERVVDHVTRVGCAACGAWHDSDFDEVVGA